MVTSEGKYFVVVLLYAYLLGYVTPFSTNLCNHNNLIEKTKEEFECDRKFTAKMFENARSTKVDKTFEFCKIVKERYKYKAYKVLNIITKLTDHLNFFLH